MTPAPTIPAKRLEEARAVFRGRLAAIVDAVRKLGPPGQTFAIERVEGEPRDALLARVRAAFPPDGAGFRLLARVPGVTFPLTVGGLATFLEKRAPGLAEELAEEIGRVARLAGDVAPALDFGRLARAWLWPEEERVLWSALSGVRGLDGEPPRLAAHMRGVSPWGGLQRLGLSVLAPRVDVAEWARAGMNAAMAELGGPPLGDILVDAARAMAEDPDLWPFLPTHTVAGKRWPGAGLALVYLAERRLRFALDAQREAAAELATWRDPDRVTREQAQDVMDRAAAKRPGFEALATVPRDARRPWADELIAEAARVAIEVGKRAMGEDYRPGGGPPDPTVAARPFPVTFEASRERAGAAVEVLAARLDALGAGELAADARAGGAERARTCVDGTDAGELWARWADERWIEMLARGLWAGRWAKAWAKQGEDEVAKLVPKVATALVSLAHVASVGQDYRGRVPLLDDAGRALLDVTLDSHTTILPAMPPDRLRRVFASMTFHRWIRYALPEIQALWRANNNATPLVIEGGKSGIIDAFRKVGLGGSRADEEVIADVIPLVGALDALLPNGRRGNLYSYTIPAEAKDWKTHSGHRAPSVKITPNEPLDPQLLHATREKQAVPIDRELPPLGWVDRTQHAAVATLTILIAQEQIEGRREIRERGGVLVTPEDWTKLINAANLRNPGGFLWQTTVDALTHEGRSDVGAAGGSPVPPFLDIVARERDGVRVILSAQRRGLRAWLDRAVAGFEGRKPKGKRRQ